MPQEQFQFIPKVLVNAWYKILQRRELAYWRAETFFHCPVASKFSFRSFFGVLELGRRLESFLLL